jgi:hypothetical protein
MKFILWTLVWLGLVIIERVIALYWLKGYEGYDDRYGIYTRFLGSAIYLFLWIYLYIKFIQ